MSDKVVLAYSGGLDTSVAIRWLKERYGLKVIALTVDVGNERDFSTIEQKALRVGAAKTLVKDAKGLFVDHFIFPALKADAVYEGQYPLATALSRPLMAKLLVDVAMEEGASAVAHGCTGKGNDQVRFEVGVNALAPELKIIAPAREWGMTREETIDYARRYDIPVPITVSSPYSIDECLWGRSIECGVLEDPWVEPPADVFSWTRPAAEAPDEPVYVEIGFDKGIPVAVDGKKMDGISLIQHLNELAGRHGVGRVDHIEDRVVGIKSREIYEAPAATVLLRAHLALEALTLSREQLRFKEIFFFFGLAGCIRTWLPMWSLHSVLLPARYDSSCSKEVRWWWGGRLPRHCIAMVWRPMIRVMSLTRATRRVLSASGDCRSGPRHRYNQ